MRIHAVARRCAAAIVTATISSALVLAIPGLATARNTGAGWQTDQPSMLRSLVAGGEVQPVMSVGERLPGGYLFESIPDGISFTGDRHKPGIMLNHETSRVPFPLATVAGEPGQTNPAGSLADFTNSLVSRLELKSRHRFGVGVKQGSYAIPRARTSSASARTSSSGRSRASAASSSSPTRRRATSCTGPAPPGR